MIMPLICTTFSCLICVIKEKDGKFVVQVSISVSLVIKAPYWQVLRAPHPGFWIIPYTTNVWRYGWHRFHLLSSPLTPHSPQPMLFSLFYMSSISPLLFTHGSDFLNYQHSPPLLLINISLCRHCSLRDGAGLSSLWSGLVCVQTNDIYFWCSNPASKSFKEPQDFPRPCCLSLGNYGFQIFFFFKQSWMKSRRLSGLSGWESKAWEDQRSSPKEDMLTHHVFIVTQEAVDFPPRILPLALAIRRQQGSCLSRH